MASSTEPPHSPPTPMPWIARSTVKSTAPQMPIESIGRHEGDGEGRQPHAQQRRDQRRLAADAIAVMAENRGADRPAGKADEIGAEREQRRRQRILIGKVELAEHQAGRGAVEKEVVPLDRRADRRCDDGLAQLRAMFGFGQCPNCRCHSHGVLPRFLVAAERASDGPSPAARILRRGSAHGYSTAEVTRHLTMRQAIGALRGMRNTRSLQRRRVSMRLLARLVRRHHSDRRVAIIVREQPLEVFDLRQIVEHDVWIGRVQDQQNPDDSPRPDRSLSAARAWSRSAR